MKPLTTEEIRAVIARGKLKDTLFKALGGGWQASPGTQG